MVRTHLPAVDSVFLTHPLLDERMPRLRHHRLAAVAGHDVYRVPRQARVVNDFRSRLLLQERLSQQADNVIPLDKRSFVIEQEAAIEVAVKGNPHRYAPDNITGAILEPEQLKNSRETLSLQHRRLYDARRTGHGLLA